MQATQAPSFSRTPNADLPFIGSQNDEILESRRPPKETDPATALTRKAHQYRRFLPQAFQRCNNDRRYGRLSGVFEHREALGKIAAAGLSLARPAEGDHRA